MSLQECSMNDLFIDYLVRLTKEYPYIRLKTDHSTTAIYLGSEVCDDQKQGFSHQGLEPLKRYSVAVDFKKLEEIFQASHTKLTFFSKEDAFLETKVKLITTNCSKESSPQMSFLFSSPLARYLARHERVILDVSKVRYYLEETPSSKGDPIPIGKFQKTTAFVVLSNGPDYYGYGIYGEEFSTSLFQIESLNPNIYDVWILHESTESVTYEILNKI